MTRHQRRRLATLHIIADMQPHLDTESVVPCVHFVGFRGEEYWSAVKVWGRPDFFHRGWDSRAQREIHETDTVVFAKGEWTQPLAKYTFDDSGVM